MPWLLHGFSTRQGGVSKEYGGGQLNLGLTAEDSPKNVERNRARFLRKLKAQDADGEPWPLVLLNQVHSAAIHRVYGARGPEWARLRKNKVAESRRRRTDHQHGGSAAGNQGRRLLRR